MITRNSNQNANGAQRFQWSMEFLAKCATACANGGPAYDAKAKYLCFSSFRSFLEDYQAQFISDKEILHLIKVLLLLVPPIFNCFIECLRTLVYLFSSLKN